MESSWWTDADIVVFVDMGSSRLGEIERCGEAAVLDHHVFDGGNGGVTHVNPRLHGLDGSHDACASTLAYLVAAGISGSNVDLVPFAIGGMIGDRQHVGGLSEVNARIVEAGVAAGHVEIARGLPLSGLTIGEALLLSNDPYIAGLSGDREAVHAFLDGMEIDPDTPLANVESDPVASSTLMSRLTIRLLRQGAALENVRSTFVEKYRFPALGMDGFDLSNVINSAGRLGEPGLGLAAVLGDGGAMEAARSMRQEYRRMVQRGLADLRERTTALRRVQWFVNKVPNMGGALAGLGVSYILDPERAAIALTPAGDVLKVSGRATRDLVSVGIDLAAAMAEAAAAVGGTGGGHPIAAGATVPADRREDFLARLDDILVGHVGAPD